MNMIVIYTAITKGYDELIVPSVVPENCDFICFTDNPKIESTIWEIRQIPDASLDSVRMCRKLKVLPHLYLSEYKYSIWIDGNVNVIGDVNELIDIYLNENKEKILTFSHPLRNCVYEEAKSCIEAEKDRVEIIQKQIDNYRKDGYPLNNGLIESNVLLREHNHENVQDVMSVWWNEIQNHSRRDQLSFNYVFWKYKYNYGIMNGNARGNSKYFQIRKHKKNLGYYIEKIIIKMKRRLRF